MSLKTRLCKLVQLEVITSDSVVENFYLRHKPVVTPRVMEHTVAMIRVEPLSS